MPVLVLRNPDLSLLRVFGFWNPSFEYWYRQLIFILMLVTVALTIVSGAAYLIGNKKYFLSNGSNDEKSA